MESAEQFVDASVAQSLWGVAFIIIARIPKKIKATRQDSVFLCKKTKAAYSDVYTAYMHLHCTK